MDITIITADADSAAQTILSRAADEIATLKTLQSLVAAEKARLQTTLEVVAMSEKQVLDRGHSVHDQMEVNVTNERQTYYEEQQIVRMQLWNHLWRFLYVMLGTVAVVSLLWSSVQQHHTWTELAKKVGPVALGIWLYPVVVPPLLVFLSAWGTKLHRLWYISFRGTDN